MVSDDRAQAYTLEGFIGSILILTAVLFALQSVVITPTTAGTVDRDARDQVRIEANDMLTLSAESGNLSKMIRYWDTSTSPGQFNASDGRSLGYSSDIPPKSAPRGLFVLLEDTFEDKNGYNVILTYQNTTGAPQGGNLVMVRNGFSTESGVVASYTITLYDDQRLTADDDRTLAECEAESDCNYPIPDAYDDSPVYNVVVVKVIVW
ncbi:hypothetical protein G9C85_00750 [Halorubellus sp. JP-L1]|uniref:DUF7288 family protein n=1 Tax=Halorubellus sp. JP-L1 TaxID=2715753 RepID=UPI00140C27B8|nr:hypothetical protein [Halorubellus sp. JP-L1]NHN40164.1 hypothetical protein [Halorubellus sp. JP-L1]